MIVGEDEILAPTKHLMNGNNINIAEDLEEIEYIHLIFDRHELVSSSGMVSESFHLGPIGISTLSRDARAEIGAPFPAYFETNTSAPAIARTVAKAFEAETIASMI
ncbi:Hint domain-containing protein [Falsihalocynthiibacter sp. SS001]|uniref:Hint domain-containing protein n=1 Tax=Falsihalocynthiibacter sp. SS001 TaxID=3349698 RepID=UPI0036D24C81